MQKIRWGVIGAGGIADRRTIPGMMLCDNAELVAVMDLICGYPDKTGALIRWFTVAADRHRQGIGSQLFADVRASLAAQGIEHLTLQVPEQEGALAFWAEQGFEATGDRSEGGRFPTVTLSRSI